jgi:hypothetical protein
MKDAWIPVIGAAAVAIISLAGAVYIRSSRQKNEIWSRWNRIGAILLGAAVAIAADHFGHLDWYFAIPLGVLAYCGLRFPAYARHGKDAKSNKQRDEISN